LKSGESFFQCIDDAELEGYTAPLDLCWHVSSLHGFAAIPTPRSQVRDLRYKLVARMIPSLLLRLAAKAVTKSQAETDLGTLGGDQWWVGLVDVPFILLQ